MEKDVDVKYYLKVGDMYLENLSLGRSISFTDYKFNAYLFYEKDEDNIYTIDHARKILKEKGFNSKIVKSVTTVTKTEEVVEEVE